MKDTINLLRQLTSLQSRFMPSCNVAVDVNFNLVPSEKGKDHDPHMRITVAIAQTKVDIVVSNMSANFSAFSSNSYITHFVSRELEKRKAKMQDKLYGRT